MSEPELLADVLWDVLDSRGYHELRGNIDTWSVSLWGTWFCVLCFERLDECDCHCRSDA